MEEGFYHDILREICSFGAGNAAARLSKMTDRKVRIDLPEVSISKTGKVLPLLSSEDEEAVVSIGSTFGGEKKGEIFVVLPFEEAKKIIGWIFKKNESKVEEFEESALLEISNILAGAIVGSIANFIGNKIMLESPQMVVDYPLDRIKKTIDKQFKEVNFVFVAQVIIRIEIEKIEILIMLFPFFDLAGEVWKKLKE
jgi:chemotaxis protein CheC